MTEFKEETMLVHPVVIPGPGTRSWTVLGDDDVPVARSTGSWPISPTSGGRRTG